MVGDTKQISPGIKFSPERGVGTCLYSIIRDRVLCGKKKNLVEKKKAVFRTELDCPQCLVTGQMTSYHK